LYGAHLPAYNHPKPLDIPFFAAATSAAHPSFETKNAARISERRLAAAQGGVRR
jgi:hypothetical protein